MDSTDAGLQNFDPRLEPALRRETPQVRLVEDVDAARTSMGETARRIIENANAFRPVFPSS